MDFRFWVCLATLAGGLACGGTTQAQVQNATIQLPVLRFFGVQTTVSVPDGATLNLGGISRSREGSSFGGFLPFRPFRNDSRGSGANSSGAQVTPRVLILSEIEEDVLREGEARDRQRDRFDRNGGAGVRSQADFITKHIGR